MIKISLQLFNTVSYEWNSAYTVTRYDELTVPLKDMIIVAYCDVQIDIIDEIGQNINGFETLKLFRIIYVMDVLRSINLDEFEDIYIVDKCGNKISITKIYKWILIDNYTEKLL